MGSAWDGPMGSRLLTKAKNNISTKTNPFTANSVKALHFAILV